MRIPAFLFLSILTIPLFAQNEKKQLDAIRQHYAYVRDCLPQSKTMHVELENVSTEGAGLTAFSLNDTLLMIRQEVFYEMGKRITEFYFKNDSLNFLFEQEIHYNRPIYWDSTRAAESGDSEVFDKRKWIIKEERLYFYKNKLFRYQDDKGDIYTKPNDYFLRLEARVFKSLIRIRSQLEL